MPDLPVARVWSVAAALPDSSLSVTGGVGRADEILDSAIRLDSLASESFVPKTFIGLYTPISDSWEMFKMPVWLDGMAVVMLPGGRLLATGGKFGYLTTSRRPGYGCRLRSVGIDLRTAVPSAYASSAGTRRQQSVVARYP